MTLGLNSRAGPGLLKLLLLLLLISTAQGSLSQLKPGQCSNGVRDPGEVDVDCGGPCSRRCGLQQMCQVAGDCDSGTCDMAAKRCACPASLQLSPDGKSCFSLQALCYNNRKDTDEGDVDCGGYCFRKCGLQSSCNTDTDCDSLYCAAAAEVSPAGIGRSDVSSALRAPSNGSSSSSRTSTASKATTTTSSSRSSSSNASNGSTKPKTQTGRALRAVNTTSSSGRSSSSNSSKAAKTCQPCPAARRATNGTCLAPGTNTRALSDQQQKQLRLSPEGSTKQPPAATSNLSCCSSCNSLCALGDACQSDGDCASQLCSKMSNKCICRQGTIAIPSARVCVSQVQILNAGNKLPSSAAKVAAAAAAAQPKAEVPKPAVNSTAADPCFNGIKDGSESDVDCGGSCIGCALDRTCGSSSDCASSSCSKATRKCICAPGTTVAPGGLSCMGTKIPEPGDFGTYCKSDKDCKAGVCNSDQKVCMCPRSQFISPDGSTCITQEELCASGGKLPSLDVDLTHIYSLACGNARPAGTSGPGNASSAGGGGKVATGNLAGTNGNITAAGMARPKSCKDGNPCDNDGVCVVAPGTPLGYTCDCLEMFSGTWCESYVINTCSTFNPCANGGVCLPAYGKAPDFTCSCAEGVSGDRCQVTSTTCTNRSNPCQNGGECYPAPGQAPDYMCGCAQGFAGASCEMNCGAEGLVPDAAGLQCVSETEDMTNELQGPGQEPGLPAEDVDAPTDNATVGNATSQPTPTADAVNAGQSGQKLVNGRGNATRASNATDGAAISSATLNVTTPSATMCDNDITPCFNGGLCSSLPGQFPDFKCSCINGFAGNMCELNCTAEGLVPDEAGRSCTLPGGPAAGFLKNSTTKNSTTNRSAAGKPLVAADVNKNATGITTCNNTDSPCFNRGRCNPLPGKFPDFNCSCSPGFAGNLCELNCMRQGLVADTSGLTCINKTALPARLNTAAVNQSGASNISQQPLSDTSPSAAATGPEAAAGAGGDSSTNSTAAGSPSPLAGIPKNVASLEARPCSNKLQDGTESDVDCGAGCEQRCVAGQFCNSAADCEKGVACRAVAAYGDRKRCTCSEGYFLLQDPSDSTNNTFTCETAEMMCINGVKDEAWEGDIDCGFNCAVLCQIGQTCRHALGCDSGFCDPASKTCGCPPDTKLSSDNFTCV